MKISVFFFFGSLKDKSPNSQHESWKKTPKYEEFWS